MIPPRQPGNEPFRLAALHALPLLDTVAEPDFDTVVQIGQMLFGTESCVITLIDAERQWFKARAGFDGVEGPRDTSFCGHAILEADVFVIPDSHKDERFHDNPAVTGAPFVRFYAGAPILLPSGYTIGTVCIFDPKPRDDFSAADRARLSQLAKLALTAITVRALRQDLDVSRGLADRFEGALQAVPGPLALLDESGCLVFSNDAFVALCPTWPDAGTDLATALGLGAEAWSAEAMRAANLREMQVQAGDTRLAVYRDGGGFIVAPLSLT
jgi:PAS domain-containing protein